MMAQLFGLRGSRCRHATIAAAAAAASGSAIMLAGSARLSACEPRRVSKPDAELSQAEGSWRLNLGRTSGFWGDARWYDAQIDRKLGLVAQMIDEIIFALPPLKRGSRVADVCAGSGRAALSLLRAYPEAHVSLIDMDTRRTQIAVDLARQLGMGGQLRQIEAVIDPDDTQTSVLPGSPEHGYDLITATCAIRVMARPPAHYAISRNQGPSSGHGSADGSKDAKLQAVGERYARLFSLMLRSLTPGGHMIIGDHSGALGCYDQLRLMEEAGFVEVDVAWRYKDWFVIGGRRPQ
eukprot:SAG31_NODE_239_length_19453_cov_5.539888_15_plen_293_part_00